MTPTFQVALRNHFMERGLPVSELFAQDIEQLFIQHGYRAPGDYSIPEPPTLKMGATWECGNIECNWKGETPHDYSGIRCCPRCDHVCQVV